MKTANPKGHRSPEKPDADRTVLLHTPESDEPVWPGFWDGEDWRYLDAELVNADVTHWTDFPDPPEPRTLNPEPTLRRLEAHRAALNPLLILILAFSLQPLALFSQPVPKVTKAKGYYLYRENNIPAQTVTCLKWTASETVCVERISTIRCLNSPTNGLIIPISAAVIERWYYADPHAHAFVSFTNREIYYANGKWTTNHVATWPIRIVEPPLAIIGKSTFTGPNGLYRIAEGDLIYDLDARKCTNDWWIAFTMRASPADPLAGERQVKFYVRSPVGRCIQWTPAHSEAWLKPVGYAPVVMLPHGEQGIDITLTERDPNTIKFE